MSAGEFERAVESYSDAIHNGEGAPEVWVKIGDACNALAYGDREHLFEAERYWEKAIEVDSTLIVAHHRLIGYWSDWGEVLSGEHRIQAYDRLRQAAERLLQVDPADKVAKLALHRATIRQWLSGKEINREEIETAAEELAKMAAGSPELGEAAFLGAIVSARRVFEFERDGDLAAKDEWYDRAITTMDTAIAKSPESPQPYYFKARILQWMGVRALEKMRDADAKIASEDLNAEIRLLTYQALDLSKPSDPFYNQIVHQAAELAARDEVPTWSDWFLQKLIAANPDDYYLRAMLAKMMYWRDARFDEAIQVLTEKRKGAPPPGVAALLQKNAEDGALVLACDIRLDRYEANANERDPSNEAMLQTVEQNLQRLEESEGERSRFLRVLGKKQLLRHDYGAAIDTLEHALVREAEFSDGDKSQIVYMLGRAYSRAERFEQAEKLLRQVIDESSFTWGRAELARVLLAQGRLDEAAENLELVRKAYPKATEVRDLELTLAEKRKR